LLEAYLSDNTKARSLQPDGRYTPIDRGSEAFNSQTYFIDRPGSD
jgi:polyphosphate kinase